MGWWHDRRVRGTVFQLLLVAGVVAGFGFIATNAISNLNQQNIASGFGFLDETAGFGVNQTVIAYDEQDSYGRVFVVGLLNTLIVSVIGIVVATLLGFLIGIARLSTNWLVAKLAAAYVELVRNVPLLLQIFFWYFGVLKQLPHPRDSLTFLGGAYLNIRGLNLPRPLFEDGFGLVWLALGAGIAGFVLLRRRARSRQLATGAKPLVWPWAVTLIAGLPLAVFLAVGAPLDFEMPRATRFNITGGIRIIPEMVALVLALSIYTAAFIAEIVRAGILSVPKGQTEAARALGLKPGTILRLVVIPQAMRVIIPPLTSQYLNLAKNSSLAVAIAYPDLVSVFAGTALNQTGQALEIIAMTMAVYLVISLTTSSAMNLYNARAARYGG